MKHQIKSQKKSEIIVAYKSFDKNLQCRGFQYEVGKTYEHKGKVAVCQSGFHSCENPFDVWDYYGPCDDNRFASVKVGGAISRHEEDSKIASASITIGAELKLPDFLSAAIKWALSAWASDAKDSGNYSQLAASGNYSKLAASGHYSQLAASGDSSKLAASGHYSQLAASGHYSQLAASGDSSKLAASGDYSQLAASGDYSKLAASGDYSQLAASGYSSIAVASAENCEAMAGELGCIVLTRWVESEKRYRVSVGYVGENIKAGVLYTLNADGKFVEAA
jgi:hypothetical protein